MIIKDDGSVFCSPCQPNYSISKISYIKLGKEHIIKL